MYQYHDWHNRHLPFNKSSDIRFGGQKILSLIMIVLHCVKKNTIHWAASIQLTIGRSEGHGHLKKRSTWRSWQHVVSLSCPAVIVYAVCKKPNYQMSEDNEGSSAGVAVLSKSLETAGFRVLLVRPRPRYPPLDWASLERAPRVIFRGVWANFIKQVYPLSSIIKILFYSFPLYNVFNEW